MAAGPDDDRAERAGWQHFYPGARRPPREEPSPLGGSPQVLREVLRQHTATPP
jgi:hypothetical protein